MICDLRWQHLAGRAHLTDHDEVLGTNTNDRSAGPTAESLSGALGQGEGVLPDFDRAVREHPVEEVHRRAADEPGDERVRRLSVEPFRRVHLLNNALVHHDDAITECHRLRLVMRDVDGGDPDSLMQAQELRTHLDTQLGVEVRERLIHQKRLRSSNERTADCHTLALAAGELTRLSVEQVGDAEQPSRLSHRGFERLPSSASAA